MRRLLLLGLAACSPGTAAIGTIDPTATGPGPTPTATATTPTEEPPGTGGTGTSTPVGDAPDYRLAGPYAVVASDLTVQTSCGMSTQTFVPQGVTPIGFVVLAHGWMRSEAQVVGWAEHWASWGVAVAAPKLCHADLLDTNHPQNADDLEAVAEALAPGEPVVFAGHSAGGLAAFLAAEASSTVVGHVGLDLTDSDALAIDAAAALAVPTWGLLAEPEACNSEGNGEEVYLAAGAARAIRIPGADHCDFESPTDWGCTTFCANGSSSDADVHDAILPLSTAAVLSAFGDPLAPQWWTPDTTWYETLAGVGAIEPVAW